MGEQKWAIMYKRKKTLRGIIQLEASGLLKSAVPFVNPPVGGCKTRLYITYECIINPRLVFTKNGAGSVVCKTKVLKSDICGAIKIYANKNIRKVQKSKKSNLKILSNEQAPRPFKYCDKYF